jgi:hypothetical protein
MKGGFLNLMNGVSVTLFYDECHIAFIKHQNICDQDFGFTHSVPAFTHIQ